jgi:hypothetical protein
MPYLYFSERELRELRRGFAQAQHELRAIRLELALRNYDPNQPRVPRGNAGGGQWAKPGASGARIGDYPRRRVAEVVRICIASGKSLSYDMYGNKTYVVIYDCPGGRSITLRGYGHNPRGLIPDPFPADE